MLGLKQGGGVYGFLLRHWAKRIRWVNLSSQIKCAFRGGNVRNQSLLPLQPIMQIHLHAVVWGLYCSPLSTLIASVLQLLPVLMMLTGYY